MSKRKGLSKKTRFEVFKRDSFTCQYCGAKAPDAILHVDHIKPVASGGKNELTNLITSCSGCNSGKGAVLLSDDAQVKKKQAQAELLQERRQQLEMVFEWHQELSRLHEESVEKAADYWSESLDNVIEFNEVGLQKISRLIKRYSFQEVLAAIDIAIHQYIKRDENGLISFDSVDLASSKLPGICNNKRREGQDPTLKDVYYIRAILRNRLNYCNEWQSLEWIKQALDQGVPFLELKHIACNVRNWTEFRKIMEEIEDVQEDD